MLARASFCATVTASSISDSRVAVEPRERVLMDLHQAAKNHLLVPRSAMKCNSISQLRCHSGKRRPAQEYTLLVMLKQTQRVTVQHGFQAPTNGIVFPSASRLATPAADSPCTRHAQRNASRIRCTDNGTSETRAEIVLR